MEIKLVSYPAETLVFRVIYFCEPLIKLRREHVGRGSLTFNALQQTIDKLSVHSWIYS